jgi:hypothetical protein
MDGGNTPLSSASEDQEGCGMSKEPYDPMDLKLLQRQLEVDIGVDQVDIGQANRS